MRQSMMKVLIQSILKQNFITALKNASHKNIELKSN